MADQAKEIANLIIKYREYEYKYELEKYLNDKNNGEVTPRFYKILMYNQYFSYSTEKIILKNNGIEIIADKLAQFKKLIAQNKLIEYNQKNPTDYYKLLRSKKNLIDFHNKSK